jgi:tetratricopeptide (TPR) repeat protein
MRSASGTGSEPRAPLALTALLLAGVLAVAGLAACAANKSRSNDSMAPDDKTSKTILLTRRGESSIKVSESELNGDQIVRVNTVFQGQENTIVLDIDQPVYEVEIPLSLEQVMPQAGSARVRGPEGQFQDLLVAQYLQKAQESMMAGDYNGALKQVDTVLQIQPSHSQAHAMKGSVYYALGNYDLANQEWDYVLAQDPSNKEVLEFKKFLSAHQSGQPPKLPGAPEGTQLPAKGPAAPRAPAPGSGGSKP